jgi:hypothetical protein
MKNFTNEFDITFNPTNFGEGFFNKNRARITVVLENVNSVQKAKEVLAEQGIFVESIQRLN